MAAPHHIFRVWIGLVFTKSGWHLRVCFVCPLQSRFIFPPATSGRAGPMSPQTAPCRNYRMASHRMAWHEMARFGFLFVSRSRQARTRVLYPRAVSTQHKHAIIYRHINGFAPDLPHRLSIKYPMFWCTSSPACSPASSRSTRSTCDPSSVHSYSIRRTLILAFRASLTEGSILLVEVVDVVVVFGPYSITWGTLRSATSSRR